MAIQIITLEEAAVILRMTPEGLRRKAAAGEIPAFKPGKRWCFIEEDLVQHLRSLYTNKAKAIRGAYYEEKILCHSAKEAILGGFDSPTVVSEYKKALGLPTKPRLNASMMSSKQSSGKKTI